MFAIDSTAAAIARYSADSLPVFALRRVRLTRGGYEMGTREQRYWGHAEPLYRAETPDGEIVLHARAATREQAKAAIAARCARARFTR
jgi:hypothetical protein